MSIQDDLQQALTDAMRSKDRKVLDAVRNARSEVQKAQTAPGFDRVTDDAFYQDVIGAYVKRLRKALETFEAAGARGEENAAKLRFEIDYLSRWLPRTLDETATQQLVDMAIAELGATTPKESGKVVGAVMRAHKGEVDAALVRRIADARLAG